MASNNPVAFGIYPSVSSAERAVNALMADGFASSDISVLLKEPQSTKEFAQANDTTAPEGANTGAATGGVIGGTLGLLAGMGAMAIPGIGPLIAAGPIIAPLAGLGMGGALGGLVGALVGTGIPEHDAKRYEGRVIGGGTLLSIHCDTLADIDRAKDVLKATGADDIAFSGAVVR
jgi:hypothetical protein